MFAGLPLLALLSGSAHATLVLSGGGLTLVEEGPVALAPGDPAPANLATGATPFSSSDLGPELGIAFHVASNINDGAYGNSFSWIGGAAQGADGAYAGVNLGATPVADIQSIAFGRDNVVGGFTDRHLGLYTLQFTNVANPDSLLVTTGTAATGWQDIGTLDFGPTDGPGTNYNNTWQRHRFNFNPVSATGIRLIVPATGLAGGTAIDEIELYDAPGALVPPPPPPPPLSITPAAGFTIGWDGNNGDSFDSLAPPAGAIVPNNLALASNGALAFSNGDLGPELGIAFHVAANANDGFYGNSNSWIGNNTVESFVGVDLGGLFSIDAVAWGRDNGNDLTDACGGQCTDRSLGSYTLQFTMVANPDASTPFTGDATSGWQTLGLFEYLFDDASFDSFLRHQFDVGLDGGGLLTATGLRLIVPPGGLAGGAAIDEFEVFGTPTSVPPPATIAEPSTLPMLLSAGLVGLMFAARRPRTGPA